jgi:ketosteroid isomerase-like protein
MTAPATTRPATGAEASRFAQLLDEWAAAIVANDPDRIAEFAEPGWILVTPESGPIPLDRFCAAVAAGILVHTEMSFEVLEVRVTDDVAIVVAHGTNRGTWNGEHFSADELVTEVFVRSVAGWRCSVSALTPRAAATPR